VSPCCNGDPLPKFLSTMIKKKKKKRKKEKKKVDLTDLSPQINLELSLM